MVFWGQGTSAGLAMQPTARSAGLQHRFLRLPTLPPRNSPAAPASSWARSHSRPGRAMPLPVCSSASSSSSSYLDAPGLAPPPPPNRGWVTKVQRCVVALLSCLAPYPLPCPQCPPSAWVFATAWQHLRSTAWLCPLSCLGGCQPAESFSYNAGSIPAVLPRPAASCPCLPCGHPSKYGYCSLLSLPACCPAGCRALTDAVPALGSPELMRRVGATLLLLLLARVGHFLLIPGEEGQA